MERNSKRLGLDAEAMLFSLAVLAARRGIASHGQTSYYNAVTESHNYCVNGTPVGVPSSVRVVVGITCALSMVGAALIILSYVLIKDIRSKAREILLNLSLMDFVVAAANLIGILINFDDYLYDPGHLSAQRYRLLDNVCKAQAFFAMYSTISSILWTNCIAVYIFFHIMLEGQTKVARMITNAFYVMSYGLPLIVNLWFVLTGKLGYSEYGSSGWCSVIVYNSATGARYPMTLIFANDIWIYLTLTLVPLIFISLKLYSRYEVSSWTSFLQCSSL